MGNEVCVISVATAAGAVRAAAASTAAAAACGQLEGVDAECPEALKIVNEATESDLRFGEGEGKRNADRLGRLTANGLVNGPMGTLTGYVAVPEK